MKSRREEKRRGLVCVVDHEEVKDERCIYSNVFKRDVCGTERDVWRDGYINSE